MSRGRVGAAGLGCALLTVLATAGPAAAGDNSYLGPQEGADVHSGLSLAGALLLYVLVPLVVMAAIWALVWLPGMMKSDRYRPQKGWSAAPLWFAGPPDPVAAVETADPHGVARGGASGNW